MKASKKSKFKSKKLNIPSMDPKTKKEVARILKQNMRCNIGEAANIFARHFISSLIKEQEDVEVPAQEATPENFTPEKNKEDFEKSLEKQTPNDQYDVEGISPEVRTKNIEKINEISLKLKEFVSFLNDPQNPESLHNILAADDKPGSLLRGVTRKTSDNITRTAGEIDKLKEVLNSFIILAPKKMRDTEQLSANA
jgi:hypothetical protein